MKSSKLFCWPPTDTKNWKQSNKKRRHLLFRDTEIERVIKTADAFYKIRFPRTMWQNTIKHKHPVFARWFQKRFNIWSRIADVTAWAPSFFYNLSFSKYTGTLATRKADSKTEFPSWNHPDPTKFCHWNRTHEWLPNLRLMENTTLTLDTSFPSMQ